MKRKTDRRTLMTKQMIKDALLELLAHTPYEKVTVSALCRQAEITRATFYLHYDNTESVLSELLDDALRLTELADRPQAPWTGELLEKPEAAATPADLDAMLPACQRAATRNTASSSSTRACPATSSRSSPTSSVRAASRRL